jgi:glycosyltransferase involved in cell wall biosynthesis
MRSNNRHVVQATAWYPPYNIGGTEVYVEGLVSELAARGITSTVVVPRHAAAAELYELACTSVETYPVNEAPTPDEIRTGTRHFGFDEFVARLRAHSGAIYHQHSWSRGCGPHHLRAAREMGFRTVITVHVPGNICLRGTMLRYSVHPCNGLVEERRCGACWAHSRGLPKSLAQLTASLPAAFSRSTRHGTTRLNTAFSARALGAERAAGLREMIENADHIVAVCQWLYEALEANGAPRTKLVLSRQGISPALRDSVRFVPCERRSGGTMRLLYLGRWSRIKGIDTVVRAVSSLPKHVSVRLSIRAIAQSPDEQAYEAEVRALARADARIVFEPPVKVEQLAPLLAGHDVLVVPSICLETGPLVVLEAQAMGLFVLGSRLGGIAELVDETDGGTLIPAGDDTAWASTIEHLARLHAAGALPRHRRPVRAMDAVAADMADLYETL